MIKKFSVIDIGTNTFHLLIVNYDFNTQKYTELIRKRIFVKLGEKSLLEIGDQAFLRGLNAIELFAEILQKYNCTNYKVFGTAAMRNAKNADQFIEEVYNKFDIQINKISGDREASLIWKGIQQSITFQGDPYLIMDVGGGSVEFIIASQTEILFSKSYVIGVAVLSNKFHNQDPISKEELTGLQSHLSKELEELTSMVQEHKPLYLVGASGTFDVLENVFPKEIINPSASSLDTTEFSRFVGAITKLNINERKNLSSIPDNRADLIVVALHLIEFVWNLHPFKELVVSKYAMKEGMLSEMIQQEDISS